MVDYLDNYKTTDGSDRGEKDQQSTKKMNI